MIHSTSPACAPDTFGNNAKYSVLDFKLTHEVLSSVQAVPKSTLDGYILLFKNKVGQVLFQYSLQTGDRIVNMTFSQHTSQLVLTTNTNEFRCPLNIQELLTKYALKDSVYTKEQAYSKEQTYSKDQIKTQLPYLQTGINNTIIGDYQAAVGNSIIVGQKTFLMDAVAILGDGQSLSCRVNKAINLEIGDMVSLVDRRHYYNCARISSIESVAEDCSLVTLQVEPQFNITQMVEYLPTGDIEDPAQKGYLFVLAKPTCGQIALSQGNVAEGSNTQATYTSHAQGFNTKAYGRYSHTEGYGTLAGYVSHAQGINTQASGEYAHAQGDSTKALGQKSHAEGYGTQAKAPYAHAEGNSNQAAGEAAHAEGTLNNTRSAYAHTEGAYNITGCNSFLIKQVIPFGYDAESPPPTTMTLELDSNEGLAVGDVCSIRMGGNLTDFAKIEKIWQEAVYEGEVGPDAQPAYFTYYISLDNYPAEFTRAAINKTTAGAGTSVAHIWVNEKQDIGTTIIDAAQHAEGYDTKALMYAAHAEGYATIAAGRYSHAEGTETLSAYAAHAEGRKTKATGRQAHSEGYSTLASGEDAHSEGIDTKATGGFSHAEGYGSESSGAKAHAEGYKTTASGEAAHSEGYETEATELGAHAEGSFTDATGQNSHAEGKETVASGDRAHAEGFKTEASGLIAHAEGQETVASAKAAHAEGESTTASGERAHAEGHGTEASGIDAHAEGSGTIASGTDAHAEGNGTVASGLSAHAEGYGTQATKNYAHAQGYATRASGPCAHAQGSNTIASGDNSHAEGYSYGGYDTTASGKAAHAEGQGTQAGGEGSHAQGRNTKANGAISHAEGNGTETTAESAHAEGKSTKAGNTAAHAEGQSTQATGKYSHAEGVGSKAAATGAHAQGSWTNATADYAHAEGASTFAVAKNSHAEGNGTYATGEDQHVQGRYNITDNSKAHIVGNGTSSSDRKNIHVLDWNGDAYFAGDVYVQATKNSTPTCTNNATKLATQQYVNTMFGRCVRISSIVKLTNDDTPQGGTGDPSIEELSWPDVSLQVGIFGQGGVIAFNPGLYAYNMTPSAPGEDAGRGPQYTLVNTITFGKLQEGNLEVLAQWAIADGGSKGQPEWKFMSVPAGTNTIVLKMNGDWYERYGTIVTEAVEIMAVIT